MKLRVQNHIINLTLRLGIFAIDGECPCDVRRVAFVLGSGVNEYEITVFERRIVFDIMQDRRVVAASNDRIVGDATRAFVTHIGFHQRFDLSFVHAGLDLFHRKDVSLAGDVSRALHQRNFFVRFMKSHLARSDRRVLDRVRRIGRFKPADTLFGQISENLLVESHVYRKAVVEYVATVEHLRKIAGELLNRKCPVRSVLLDGAFDALTTAVPRLHHRIARADIEREWLL